MDALTGLLDDVAYCQPARPDIAQYYAGEYHRRTLALTQPCLTGL